LDDELLATVPEPDRTTLRRALLAVAMPGLDPR
jgi:hypothetical protein